MVVHDLSPRFVLLRDHIRIRGARAVVAGIVGAGLAFLGVVLIAGLSEGHDVGAGSTPAIVAVVIGGMNLWELRTRTRDADPLEPPAQVTPVRFGADPRSLAGQTAFWAVLVIVARLFDAERLAIALVPTLLVITVVEDLFMADRERRTGRRYLRPARAVAPVVHATPEELRALRSWHA